MSEVGISPLTNRGARDDLKRRLLEGVHSGEWKPGQAIPAESQLCARFGVSAGAVRDAVNELVAENLLVRVQGGGTIVAKNRNDQSPAGAAAAGATRAGRAGRYEDLVEFFSPWRPATLRKNWPGISISVVIALAASFVAATYGGPQLLYALFFGLAFHFLSQDATCRPGIDFCSKTLLRTGVALLGARITFTQITSLGAAPIAIVLCAVTVTILFGLVLAKWLKRPLTEGVLSGGAVGICGASAALAISAVLPQTKENEKYTLLTVVGVTTLSTVAMITYPLLVKLAGLNATAAGIFIGGSIHDVAQVVGAGYLISTETGDVATFVKLTRVACLVPVVVMLTILFKSRSGQSEFDAPPLIPFFLIGFVWLMICNSFGFIPAKAGEWINHASRGCLVAAIAALGVKTSFQSLASLGWRPVMMLVAETVWLAVFILVALHVIS